ncbi:hypothetical protein BC833DRAFT_609014 [Globomyces pollinis-pini]|nr:hypothetical protein BC833DRAFT_609014 [Globomyces pollinis-pini]
MKITVVTKDTEESGNNTTLSSYSTNVSRFDELFKATEALTSKLEVEITKRPLIRNTNNSQSDLVNQINDVFRHQQSINHLQYSITSANYMANIVNFTKNKKLENIIARGQKEILSLTRTISTLKTTIESLDQDISTQKEEAIRLEICLKDTQAVLKKAIIQYRRELDEQKEKIEAQGIQIVQLAKSRIMLDGCVDLGLLLISIMFMRNTLLKSLLNNFIIFTPPKWKRTLRSILQFISVMTLFARLRYFLSLIGIHGGVGSISEYARYIFGLSKPPTFSSIVSLPPKPFNDRKLIKP